VTRPSAAELLAVAVGGVIGAAARWGLDLLIPHDPDEFPVSTLTINLAGTFLLAYLVAEVWTRPVPSWTKAGVGPGILGTFTTFSAVVLAVVTLAEAGEAALAGLYLTTSLLGGLFLAFIGFSLGNRRRAGRVPEQFE
jgi:CrcB protein